MSPEQLAKIEETVRHTIETVVNGKVDRINYKLDNYIKEDNIWKDNVTPSIEIMKKMQGFGSVGGWVLKTVILIGSAVTAIYAFFKFVIHK